MARFLYQVHIADGFVDDCEELIQRCTQTETLTYPLFAEIWKEMDFGNIYQGRTMGVEVAELSEEVILIAKRFMLASPGNYEEQVAGLFLVYGLINLQPFPGFAPLRLVPDDVPAIGRIEMIARRDRRLDVLYILGQVLIKGPVQFAAAEREYGFEASLRKYHEGLKLIDTQGIRPLGLFKRQNEELDVLREIKHVSRLYHGVKKHITDDKPDRNLNYSDEGVYEEADISLKRLLNGDFNDPVLPVDESEHSKRSNHLFEIRRRAMQHAVDNIKHLTGVEQRMSSSKKCESPKEDLASKKGSPNKRRGKKGQLSKRSMKGKGKGKRTRKDSSSSESEGSVLSDEALSSATDEEIEDMLKGESFELDIAKLKEANPPEAIKDIISAGTIDVELPLTDSMPVIISSDPSQSYEIEIIDNYEKKDIKTIDDDVLSEMAKKPLKKRKIDLRNATFVAEKTTDMETKISEQQQEVFKKPLVRTLRSGVRSKKKKKKNSRLETTLRRLGLRSIASFEKDDSSDDK